MGINDAETFRLENSRFKIWRFPHVQELGALHRDFEDDLVRIINGGLFALSIQGSERKRGERREEDGFGQCVHSLGCWLGEEFS